MATKTICSRLVVVRLPSEETAHPRASPSLQPMQPSTLDSPVIVHSLIDFRCKACSVHVVDAVPSARSFNMSLNDLPMRLASPAASAPSPYRRRMARYFLSWIVPSISRITLDVGERRKQRSSTSFDADARGSRVASDSPSLSASLHTHVASPPHRPPHRALVRRADLRRRPLRQRAVGRIAQRLLPPPTDVVEAPRVGVVPPHDHRAGWRTRRVANKMSQCSEAGGWVFVVAGALTRHESTKRGLEVANSPLVQVADEGMYARHSADCRSDLINATALYL